MIVLAIVAATVATGLLAFLAVGTPVSGARRAVLVCLLPLALGASAAAMHKLAAGPMPHWLEFRSGATELVARDFREGVAIHLWVRWPDDPTPRGYTMPWSEEAAEQIEAAEGKAEEEGGELIVEFSREGDERRPENEGYFDERLSEMLSLEDRPPPVVYQKPHPRPPAKERQAAPSFDFPVNRGWAPLGAGPSGG